MSKIFNESPYSLFDKLNEKFGLNHSDTTSYKNIYTLRQSFIRSSGHSDTIADEFNYTETPGSLYFQIFFHFNTGFGLLNPYRKEYIDDGDVQTRYSEAKNKNTAANYLWTNLEFQRLQLLDDFVKLLSNINTYSPWYFQTIDGLGEALTRSEYDGSFELPEESKYITIKCLEDSYDGRISTLLDLYKAICYSYTLHKEILPANLRRFDMSVYIINTPIGQGVHYENKAGWPTFKQPSYEEWKQGSNQVVASSKLFEFQGCEICANSFTNAYNELKNDEPFELKHEIKIKFQRVVEQRYNEFLDRIIGDYIFSDMDLVDRKSDPWDPDNASLSIVSDDVHGRTTKASEELEPKTMQQESSKKTNIVLDYLKKQGTQIVSGALNTVVGKATKYIDSLTGTLNKYILGNLFYGVGAMSDLSKYTNKMVANALDMTIGRAVGEANKAMKEVGNGIKSNMGKLFDKVDYATSLGWIKNGRS